MINVLYFAWLRDHIGVAQEQVSTRARNVQELVNELCAKDERYSLAFKDLTAVRVAVDQELSALDAPLAGVKEVAFFPPMTGG